MGAGLRALRRRVLTPNASATSIEKRQFYKKSPAAQELLETVGTSFIAGFSYAAEAAALADAVGKLETVPTRFRGFAYEGAAMGFAIRDGLPLGGDRHVHRFLAGDGSKHIYTAYVGVGWAMARLPRFRWPDPESFDPLLRWLVLDGYGFHQAYFRTRRYVHEQYQPAEFRWIDRYRACYALRAIDQGIGRALWFVGGTDASRVTTLIERFADSRKADLYSGAGLAATYAGGADEGELRAFWDEAGDHRAQIAQAAAFAAEARVRGDVVVPHTELATRIFCGTTPERAARLTQDARSGLPADGAVPAYETWRQSIANEFAVMGGN
ncbi:DUF1702 family protein [Haloechinothrix halophila]|uniref:DUF1702 family protein n=1 Tax=Haloechinothrix halophila TaxID=1069073 RepID=UPI00041487AB|nr:DUF1702 family protein [Haloechinothrix halophila]